MVKQHEVALNNSHVCSDEFLEIYEDIAEWTGIPNLKAIYGHYCMMVDMRLDALQRSLYLDDYDSSSGNIPDGIVEDVNQYVGIPIDMDPEEVKFILTAEGLFFHDDKFINNPIQEVW